MVNNPRLGPISPRAGSFLPVFHLVPLLVGVGLFGSFSYGDPQEGLSPSGKLRFRTSGEKPNPITIELASSPESATPLVTLPSSYVNIIFSPDEKWILVRAFAHKLEGSLHLFKHTEGVTFGPVPGRDIGAKVQAALLADIPGAQPASWEASCPASIWSAESNAILLGVSGRGRTAKADVSVTGWFAVYDLKKQAVSFDMNAYRFDLTLTNRGAAKLGER